MIFISVLKTIFLVVFNEPEYALLKAGFNKSLLQGLTADMKAFLAAFSNPFLMTICFTMLLVIFFAIPPPINLTPRPK